MAGAYALAAPELSARGACPVPCGADKRPLVKWVNLSRSTARNKIEQWAKRYPEANLGLLTGERSGVVAVDVDSTDSSLVREVEQRFGASPLVVQTPRGGQHHYFQFKGERNRAKLDGLPVDVRGEGGYLVAPRSIRDDGAAYTFLRGTWDDLAHLPPLKPGSLPVANDDAELAPIGSSSESREICRVIGEGQRNDKLWRLVMDAARSTASVEELVVKALALNESICAPPLAVDEVHRIVRSAWSYKLRGRIYVRNRGEAQVFLDMAEVDRLGANPEAVLLLMKLRHAHEPAKEFALSPKGMAAAKVIACWDAKRFRRARDVLLAEGLLERTHRGGNGPKDPDRYRLVLP